MMKSTDTSPALLVIGNLAMQAAARGDAAALRDHLTVYEAVVKAATRQKQEARACL